MHPHQGRHSLGDPPDALRRTAEAHSREFSGGFLAHGIGPRPRVRNHKVLASQSVKFDVPRVSIAAVRADEKGKASADEAFLTKVIPGTAASVKVIEYAAKHATDEKVRDFAERVAKQHKEFVNTASGHAKRLNIVVVANPDKDSKATIDKLSELKGTDLDVAFLQWLSDGHENTAVFDDEVKNGADTDLKTFANNAITSGHEHLHEARELLARVEK